MTRLALQLRVNSVELGASGCRLRVNLDSRSLDFVPPREVKALNKRSIANRNSDDSLPARCFGLCLFSGSAQIDGLCALGFRSWAVCSGYFWTGLCAFVRVVYDSEDACYTCHHVILPAELASWKMRLLLVDSAAQPSVLGIRPLLKWVFSFPGSRFTHHWVWQTSEAWTFIFM